MSIKEELNEENRINDLVDSITDNIESDEYVSQFGDLTTDTENDEVVAVKKKKKSPLYTSIIIAIVVLFVAVLGYVAVEMFVPTIEGTWLYEAEDGTKMYYTFNDSAESNKLTISMGTVYSICDYEIATGEDDAQQVTLITDAGYSNQTYTYSISGNKLFRNRVLTLIAVDSTTGQETKVELPQANKPKVSDYIQPDENFKEVEALTGEWVYKFEDMGVNLTLTFNDDGTMVLNQFGYQEMHCTYTADDSKISFSFVNTDVVSEELEYSFKDGQLIFMNYNWVRAEDATPDEG
ncbi:MAG: hypothetical protein IKB73_01700 [Ruminococcus sp.]|nr:hypothetical protein [Ruminococcus sp.]